MVQVYLLVHPRPMYIYHLPNSYLYHVLRISWTFAIVVQYFKHSPFVDQLQEICRTHKYFSTVTKECKVPIRL